MRRFVRYLLMSVAIVAVAGLVGDIRITYNAVAPVEADGPLFQYSTECLANRTAVAMARLQCDADCEYLASPSFLRPRNPKDTVYDLECVDSRQYLCFCAHDFTSGAGG